MRGRRILAERQVRAIGVIVFDGGLHPNFGPLDSRDSGQEKEMDRTIPLDTGISANEGQRTYGFRISGYYAGGSWELSEPHIDIALPGTPHCVTMTLPKRRERDGRKPINFRGGGFKSEAEAREVGARVKTSLILAAVTIGFGIDLGSDEVVSPAAKGSTGRADERLQPHVYGLQTFPELENMLFGFLYDAEPVPKNLRERFETTFKEAYALPEFLTKKQLLAAQLYAHSYFQPFNAARLLLLVSAIEALADIRRRSAAAVGLVDKMIELVASPGISTCGRRALSRTN